MKNHAKRIGALLFVTLISLVSAKGQQIVGKGGFTAAKPLDSDMRFKNAHGMDLSLMYFNKKAHYIGLSIDYHWANDDGKAIHIANNLMEFEAISSHFDAFTFGIINYFDLTPKSNVKVFAGNRLGYRSVDFKAYHEGSLLIFFPTTTEIYRSKKGGIMTEFSLSLYVPFTKSPTSPVGMEFKTAYTTGSKVRYIDTDKVYYNEVDFVIGAEKESNVSLWLNTLSILWRF